MAAVAAALLALAACSGGTDGTGASPTVTAPASSTSAPAPALDDRPLDEQLLAAVTSGDAELAALALDAGADPNASSEDGSGNTALTLAVTRDDVALVELLVDAGAAHEDPDTGFTALALVARFGGPEVATVLLEAGASADGRAPWTGLPLAESAYEGNLPVMALLLESGADPNARVSGDGGFTYTPLFSAAYGGSREAADLLLQWGADPAWADEAGDTAGGVAAGQGHRELGEYLDSLISSEG